jgi:hypothetical protein
VRRLVQATRVESRAEAPEHVVRFAKAMGSLLLPPQSGLSRLIGRFVGDAFPDAALAGMRSEDRISRHALYEAGDFYVDVRVEQERGAPRATLIGQLTNRTDPDSALAEAPVLLLARKDLIGYAVYNRFGEFHMEYPPAPNLRLCIALDASGNRIELSLKHLAAHLATPPDGGTGAA